MTLSSPVTITVPGTTANLGVGFDCLGAALTIYNHFKFSLLTESAAPLKIVATGRDAERVSTDATNLAYRAFVKLYDHLGKTPPPIALEIKLGVPLARGLGSSATAIVGGLLGANHLAGNPLTPSEVMDLAIALEGHPDNVVPALLGNCQLSVSTADQWQICPLDWHLDLIPIVAIPNFELSTEEARAVLPAELSRADAIFNISRMGLLIAGLASNRADWLKVALADRLHQPYRFPLIRGCEAVREAALSAGAYGVVISGAGPTLLALADRTRSDAVAAAMETAWETQGIKVEARSLALDFEGARIEL